VRRACQGRPVTEDQLALLAQQVEDVIRGRGSGEIPSQEIGLAILGPLRDLDEVAYLRFASVYRGFESLTDFEEEIASLRAAHLDGWRPDEMGFFADEAGPDSGDPDSQEQGGAAERRSRTDAQAGYRGTGQTGQPAPQS